MRGKENGSRGEDGRKINEGKRRSRKGGVEVRKNGKGKVRKLWQDGK